LDEFPFVYLAGTQSKKITKKKSREIKRKFKNKVLCTLQVLHYLLLIDPLYILALEFQIPSCGELSDVHQKNCLSFTTTKIIF